MSTDNPHTMRPVGCLMISFDEAHQMIEVSALTEDGQLIAPANGVAFTEEETAALKPAYRFTALAQLLLAQYIRSNNGGPQGVHVQPTDGTVH